MANIIAWEPSLDPTVTPSGSYIIEGATQTTGPWSVLATVSASLTPPPSGTYDAIVNRFVYNDDYNPYTTWYRIIDVASNGKFSRPSDPFLTHEVPYFIPGSTPYGIFDRDVEFQADADRNADFIRKKLGEPVMEVHLSASQIYASFEEACLEYSAMINSYQAKSTLTTFLGSPTGTLEGSENKYPMKTLSLAKNIADPYNAEGGVNSSLPIVSASIELVPGQQGYDIPLYLRTHDNQGQVVPSGSTTSSLGLPAQWNGSGSITIREVYHKSPMSAYRFFGTTSGLNYLNSQFRFESFTPETMFYMLPVWEDILRGMQFKTSNTVRRSNYSYDIHGSVLRIFPCPQDNRHMWFTFSVDANPSDPSGQAGGQINPSYNGVSNISNIPFGNIQYSHLNSLSKNWIRRMTLAFAKEIEGQIRSKFTSLPIPNGEVTLNGPELITDARAEMEGLRAELKEMLEETTYQKLMEKEAAMNQNLQETWKGVPLGIYVG